MDAIKIVALFLLVFVLAFALNLGDGDYQKGDLPRIYLNVDRIRPYEEYGSVTLMGHDTMRDVGVLVKKRGNSTINADKMSFGIRFMKNTRLFDMDANDRWILIGVPFDKTLIRTELGFGYASAIGLEGISQTMFCDLYLRGKYHGLYILTEPVTARGLELDVNAGDFLLERNLDRSVEGNLYIVTKKGLRFELTAGTDAWAQERCIEVVNRAEEAIATGNMGRYKEFIDIDSFVNAYIAQELTKHIDFAMFSDRYYVRDGKLFAGPLWDLDLSMGNVTDRIDNEQYNTYNNLRGAGNDSQDSAQGFWAQRDWYEDLCRDPEFMQLVYERWLEVYPITENLVRDNELGINRIDELTARYRSSIEENYKLWNLKTRYSDLECYEIFDTYDQSVEHLRNWLIRRIDWLSEQFEIYNVKMENEV